MFGFLRPRPATPAPSVEEIAAAVARKEAYLVDVRELAELKASGKARGALHIPLATLPLKAAPAAPDALIAPGKPVAVYCAAGGRSAQAAAVLERMGYGPVWNIGGLSDWTARGGQIEKV